jgi:FixJ family two-component response regulator
MKNNLQDELDKLEHSEEGKQIMEWLESLTEQEQMVVSLAIAERAAKMVTRILGVNNTIPAKRTQ